MSLTRTTLAGHPQQTTDSSPRWIEWDSLAEAVRNFAPDVVVLVARKTPRMREALGLSFSNDGALVVSDLAIPFIRNWLKGARVAVVDDVVNVGSTLNHAVEGVRSAGAEHVQAFAIARAKRNLPLDDLKVKLIREEELDEYDLRRFGTRVPRSLLTIMKPYDLDFPVIHCEPALPFSNLQQVYSALLERYGADVYEVAYHSGDGASVRRLSIDLHGGVGAHRKIRIYAMGRRLVVVGMDISPVLPTEPIDPALGGMAWQMYSAATTHGMPEDVEACARLRLFIDSVGFTESFLRDNRDLFAISEHGLDLEDAALVLGPDVLRAQQNWHLASSETRKPFAQPLQFSPFFGEALRQGLIGKIAENLETYDVASILREYVRVLAAAVGTDDISQYRLTWPYDACTVAANPYLRLRIGGTLADLVAMILHIQGGDSADQETVRRSVTRQLDTLIDQGAIVPTTAVYNNAVYRIYRKGEGTSRDLTLNKVQHALYEYQEHTNRGLSPTRISKLLTLLAFTSDNGAPSYSVTPEKRGNVSSFQTSVVDRGAEVVNYMIRTRILREEK